MVPDVCRFSLGFSCSANWCLRLCKICGRAVSIKVMLSKDASSPKPAWCSSIVARLLMIWAFLSDARKPVTQPNATMTRNAARMQSSGVNGRGPSRGRRGCARSRKFRRTLGREDALEEARDPHPLVMRECLLLDRSSSEDGVAVVSDAARSVERLVCVHAGHGLSLALDAR